MADMPTQAMMGLIPPQIAEAKIGVRWPSVAAYPGVARLGSTIQVKATELIRWSLHQPTLLAAVLLFVTVPAGFFMALAAWFLLAPFYFIKILPGFATRYTLTTQRLMIQKGLMPKAAQEVRLDALDDPPIRVVPGSEQPFYRAADLEILSGGNVAMTLRGVPQYDSFIVNIDSARLAWGRKSPPKEQIHPATELADKK